MNIASSIFPKHKQISHKNQSNPYKYKAFTDNELMNKRNEWM